LQSQTEASTTATTESTVTSSTSAATTTEGHISSSVEPPSESTTTSTTEKQASSSTTSLSKETTESTATIKDSTQQQQSSPSGETTVTIGSTQAEGSSSHAQTVETVVTTGNNGLTSEGSTTIATTAKQTQEPTTTLLITDEITTTRSEETPSSPTSTTTVPLTGEITTPKAERTSSSATITTTIVSTGEITITKPEETPSPTTTTATIPLTGEITTTKTEETSSPTTTTATIPLTGEITTTKAEETSSPTTTTATIPLTGEITTTKQSEGSTDTSALGLTDDITTTATTTPGPVCTAVVSGDFDDPETWENGQIPSGSCSIVISANVTVTFTRYTFDIQVPTLSISGSLIFSSTTNVTFQYVIIIILEAGGSLQDQTAEHTLYFLAGSLFTFYSGSSFTGSATVIYTYSLVEGSITIGESYSFGSSISGPFTFGILLTGEIQIFYSITFIVFVSGSFTDRATWLGGIVPTAALCSEVGGCGLYIAPQCVLSTESLNGKLNIYFFQITVAFGATFQLGSSSVATNFQFFYSFSFNINGTLEFLPTSGGSIYLPFGSIFNFFLTAQFSSSATVSLRTYSESIEIYILLINLDVSFQGPYFVIISVDGEITETSEGTYNTLAFDVALHKILFLFLAITQPAVTTTTVTVSSGETVEKTPETTSTVGQSSESTATSAAITNGESTVPSVTTTTSSESSGNPTATTGSTNTETVETTTAGTSAETSTAATSGETTAAATITEGQSSETTISTTVTGGQSSGTVGETTTSNGPTGGESSGTVGGSTTSNGPTGGESSGTVGGSTTSNGPTGGESSGTVGGSTTSNGPTGGESSGTVGGSTTARSSTDETTTVVGGETSEIDTTKSTGVSSETTGTTSDSSGQTEKTTPTGERQTGETTTSTLNSICTAIASGDFTDPSTWLDAQIPSSSCSIVIPTGISVTFTGSVFDIEILQITIGGTFIISSTTDFTFQYAINIIIEAGGSFKDETTAHKLYFFAGTIWTFYTGASFTGLGTIAYQYTTLPASGSFGASYTFGGSISGPFTFGILLSGEIQTFSTVTFIVAISGGFNVRGTWLGGIAPTVDFCDSIGGCGLYISSGCNLDTSELNGQLSINFNVISIASGGTFSLGAAGLTGGFQFLYTFSFNIYGTLNFLASTGSIYLPWGCGFNFFAGAQFSSSFEVEIRTYQAPNVATSIVLISLSSSSIGPYYFSISISGDITETTGGKLNSFIFFDYICESYLS